MSIWERRKTVEVMIGNVGVGGNNPVRVQSMTNTDTADAASTAEQVAQLALAGSEIVRVTVNNEPSAQAVLEIVQRLEDAGLDVPIVGDFHYNGHILLNEVPRDRQARWPSTGSTRGTSAPAGATRTSRASSRSRRSTTSRFASG